ncbi:MAG: hypothetical protein RLZZ165_1502 [Bacteroidota bacterium]|jgi:1-acyl-sn-glycerol-3-phosphate acyltransferase
MKNIFLRIWTIWFYILFGGFYVLIFPLHWLLLKFDKRWTHNLSHRLNTIWGYVTTFPVGVWITSEGKEQLDPKRIYILASNHCSYMDIPVCNITVRTPFRFIGKAELNSVPLFGHMFKRLHIPVNRSSVTESFKSFLHAKQKLNEGVSVLVFPEATIPDKTKVTLLKFKDGAFRLAIEHKVPIVPVTIIGSDRAFPDNGEFLLHPARVHVIFHPPIETDALSIAQVGELNQQVYGTIFDCLVRHGQRKEAPTDEPC